MVVIAPYLDLIAIIRYLVLQLIVSRVAPGSVVLLIVSVLVTCLKPRWYYASKEGHIRSNLLGIFSWPRGPNRFIPAPMKRVRTGP